jgi:pyruvate dehydrogenase (quinone)
VTAGWAWLLGELLTVSISQLPVKIVVFNNVALRRIRLKMMVDGLSDYQIENGSFDYGAIARVAGIHSAGIEEPGEARRSRASLSPAARSCWTAGWGR